MLVFRGGFFKYRFNVGVEGHIFAHGLFRKPLMQIGAEANVEGTFEGLFRLLAFLLTEIEIVVHRLLKCTLQGVNIRALITDKGANEL